MKTGKVKFYNIGKGFGFIIDDETGDDVFFHATGIMPNVKLKENDRVNYLVKDGKKGLNAISIEKV